MTLQRDVLRILEETSRTFFLPINRLPHGLQEAVASAYLCMRAIDEIEDHPHLDNLSKIQQLTAVGELLQAQTSVAAFAHEGFSAIMTGEPQVLPEVTVRIGDWACLAPEAIAPRIWDATATMAARMSRWAADNWRIQTEADLDRYTFGVAGAVGLLLCDLWAWFDGVQMHRTHAIQFGRGLQAVNILRNRDQDLARNVDFFPAGWTEEHMQEYARRNLSQAEAYTRSLPSGPVAYFIKIPLVLAFETLRALARGEAKLSRSAVLQLLQDMHKD
jgi:farnesyl-diphosphate farnesyltransferase